MRLVLLKAALAVATTGFATASLAQNSTDLRAPAEVPPASFTAREYVDSRGCRYTRATINGVTTWVPRIGQNREVICGAGAGVQDLAATPPTSVAQPVASAPLVMPSAQPRRQAAAQPARSTRAQPVVRDRTLLQRATPDTVASNIRIAPRGVVESQLAAQEGVFVPHGYERVWDDDRLSLTRAHQTYAGQAQSAQIWTKSAPRRLIDRADGQARTQDGVFVPRGYAPVWDDDRLSLTRARQTASGQAQMAQFWDNRTPRRLVPREEAPAFGMSTKGGARSPVVSTRSSTRSFVAPEAVAPASHRYIEAGAFATEQKARLAASYIAKAGLPAALSRRQYKGRSYATALAGPFATQEQLDRAYSKIRKAYPGAALRP